MQTMTDPYQTADIMNLVPLSEAARRLGVDHQSVSYHFNHGKVSGRRAGNVILVDPAILDQELKEIGFYHRRNARIEGRKRRTQKEV